jgi:cell wall-associated NlpC family hydrolase
VTEPPVDAGADVAPPIDPVKMGLPARIPTPIPPYVADTGSATGLRFVDGQSASMWSGVPSENTGTANGIECSALVNAVYQMVGYDTESEDLFPGGVIGTRVSVSELDPGDLVAWSGGWRGMVYVGHMAVYVGNGKIMESVGGPPLTRELHPNDNVFGVHLNIEGQGIG